jgi:Tfp pilus assembly protein PilZ
MDAAQRKRQRMQDRVPCNLTVSINNSLQCVAFDISEGGLYIKTKDIFALGSVVKLSLPFKGDRLEVSGRVKYCLEGVGIGIMFIDLDDTLKGKIKALLQGIKECGC